ncbi:MAG: Ig-like domain-containing protein [Candidatus Peregrinibacteria bacterium]|nr:Ig-like domain-containing protein [Candidatus Peregrinibacteria bacterium]
MESFHAARNYIGNLHTRVKPLGKHMHRVGSHLHTHRKKYLAAHTAVAMLFVVLSIIGSSTNPGKVSAAAGSLSLAANNPSANATEIARDSQIMFYFNQTPTDSTVTVDGNSDGVPDHVRIIPSGGSAIAGSITTNDVMMAPNRVYIFTPASLLTAGTLYNVDITGGSSGVTANGGADYMTTNAQWSFTTVQPPSVSSGTVTSGSGPSLAEHTLTSVSPFVDGINIYPNLHLNFNGHITMATMTADANFDGVPDNAYLSYVNSSGVATKVAGTWSVNNAGSYDYANFTPTADLRMNTEYTITVTTAISSSDLINPIYMTSQYTAKFLTTGAYSINPPTVSSKSPANLEGGVVTVGTAIRVTFNQPIDPTTVAGHIVVYAEDGSSVSGTTVIDDTDQSVVKFIPAGNTWLASNTYSVKLKETVAEVVGNVTYNRRIKNVGGFEHSEYSQYWTFHTTGDYPLDSLTPMVNIGGSNVTGGASGISTTVGSITIPFLDESPMDAGTMTSANIYLSRLSTPVAGTSVTYDYATKTATLSVPALNGNTTYTIVVRNAGAGSAVTDARGNGVGINRIEPAGTVSWDFTTSAGAITPDQNGNYLCDLGGSVWNDILNSWGVNNLFFRTKASGNLAFGFGYGYTQATGWKFGYGYGYGYTAFCNSNGFNDYRAGYFFFEEGSSPTMNLAAVKVAHSSGNYVITPDEMTIAPGGDIAQGGVGSKLLLPANMKMAALDWDGTVNIGYSTAVPSGISSGKVVSVGFGNVSTGNPVKLSGAALVTVPQSGFSPSGQVVKVIGSDNVTYLVSPCTTEYNGGDITLVSSYTLGNFAAGESSAQQCYKYDSSNVYVATNHFTSFVVGTESPITAPTVSSITPANNATGVSTSTTVVVTFDQAIEPPIYTPANASISTSQDGSNPINIEATRNGDNTAVTLTLPSALAAGTKYYVILQNISPAGHTEAQYKMPLTTYSFTTAGSAATLDLSASVSGGVVTTSQSAALAVSENESPEGVGSEVRLPAGLTLKASNTWDGTINVGFSTTVPTGITSGKVVSVNFVGATSGSAVKLSSAALVVIPLSGFSPLLDAVKIIGADNITYEVSQCTSQYNNGGKNLVASYSLGNFATDAATAEQCYTYDSSNVYVATNHFTSFAAGTATSSGPGGSNSGNQNTVVAVTTPAAAVTAPTVAPVVTPAVTNTSTKSSTAGRIKDFKDLLTLSSDRWQYPIVQQMLDLGLMMGSTNESGNKVWNMNAMMTRGEAAVLIARYAGHDDKMKVTSGPFLDVRAKAWYASSVAYLKSNGVIFGKTSKIFAPDARISRAEFLKMAVVTYMKLHPSIANEWNSIMNTGSNTFADVKKSDWYYYYINLAESKKLLSGYTVGNQKFAKPSQNISRVEAAAILSKLIGL